jgi:hypothetical protein
LLDLKLKCLFEYSEAEQNRLSKMSEQSEGTQSLPPQTTVNNSNNMNGGTAKSSLSAPTGPLAASRQVSSKSHLSNVSNSSMDVYSHATDNSTADFESTLPTKVHSKQTKASTSPTSTHSPNDSIRKEKDDNTINELKLLKKENESLLRENTTLKVKIQNNYVINFNLSLY